MKGILCVNKPKDFTSHDVCNKLRKILNTKKIGHTGTLDPMATGVMGVLVGDATRLSEYIIEKDKEYIAEITFGITSDTYDITGVLGRKKEISLDEDTIKEILKKFRGEIFQKPPIYSALKVNGKPLYKYAREGKDVEIKERKIFIHNLELICLVSNDKALIKIACSKGTYIRSLCHDIGQVLGCGAVMSGLERVRSGNLFIKNALSLEQIEILYQSGQIDKYILPMDYCLTEMRRVDVKKGSYVYLKNGNELYMKNLENLNFYLEDKEKVKIYCDNVFCGVGKVNKDKENGQISMRIRKNFCRE